MKKGLLHTYFFTYYKRELLLPMKAKKKLSQLEISW